ncbi:MAG: TPM domain-containing protein, partial [Halobacteriovoraceae bacterium]|nr:TPM domain-containing protein [Halobacteriovoraceae bacterium]
STHKELSQEVHQRAIQAFYNNNLHTTRDRTGILIMVSLLEHRAEILADTGINEKVPPRTWRKILNPMVKKIKKDDLTAGLCEAIQACGKILDEHFPIKPDDKNELSNEVVTPDS